MALDHGQLDYKKWAEKWFEGLIPCHCKCPCNGDACHHQTETNHSVQEIWSSLCVLPYAKSLNYFSLSNTLSVYATAGWKTSVCAIVLWKKDLRIIEDRVWVSLGCKKSKFCLGVPNRSTACKRNEMILLLLPIQQDPEEGLKLNLFLVSTTSRAGNNKHRPKQGRFRLETRKNFLWGKILKLLDRLLWWQHFYCCLNCSLKFSNLCERRACHRMRELSRWGLVVLFRPMTLTSCSKWKKKLRLFDKITPEVDKYRTVE